MKKKQGGQIGNKNTVGKKNGKWKGGRRKVGGGYIEIYSPNHPNKTMQNGVREHRLVIENHIGRTLLPSEIVHHINNKRDDNRIENLMLFSNSVKHIAYHRTIKNWGKK